jgi:hypothetical protein
MFTLKNGFLEWIFLYVSYFILHFYRMSHLSTSMSFADAERMTLKTGRVDSHLRRAALEQFPHVPWEIKDLFVANISIHPVDG